MNETIYRMIPQKKDTVVYDMVPVESDEQDLLPKAATTLCSQIDNATFDKNSQSYCDAVLIDNDKSSAKEDEIYENIAIQSSIPPELAGELITSDMAEKVPMLHGDIDTTTAKATNAKYR